MNIVELDVQSTALVLIDLEHGIVGADRAPYSAKDVVNKCATVANRFREVGALIVYVRVDLADMVKLNVDSPSRDPNAPPPPASASELVADAGVQSSDLRITKRHWSAFLGTTLEAEFRLRSIRTMVIGGIATNFGVESTARDAAGLGFDVVFLEDAMTTISAEAHQFATSVVFPRIGRVRQSFEVQLRTGVT